MQVTFVRLGGAGMGGLTMLGFVVSRDIDFYALFVVQYGHESKE